MKWCILLQQIQNQLLSVTPEEAVALCGCMIITTNYKERVNGEITEICSTDEPFCPVCGGCLIPHGRCFRKLMLPEGEKLYSLKVLYCPECCRSHRELTDCMIPYKRHSAETYAQIYDTSPDKLDCDVDEKTVRTIRTWVTRFLAFAAIIQSKVLEHYPLPFPPISCMTALSKLKYYVQLVVNTNFWSFSVPPLVSR